MDGPHKAGHDGDFTYLAAICANPPSAAPDRAIWRDDMPDFSIDRRGLMLGAAAAPVIVAAAQEPAGAQPPPGRDPSAAASTPDQQRRMKWWHDAKFGMFIHFGLYAAHGRHEWA